MIAGPIPALPETPVGLTKELRKSFGDADWPMKRFESASAPPSNSVWKLRLSAAMALTSIVCTSVLAWTTTDWSGSRNAVSWFSFAPDSTTASDSMLMNERATVPPRTNSSLPGSSVSPASDCVQTLKRPLARPRVPSSMNVNPSRPWSLSVCAGFIAFSTLERNGYATVDSTRISFLASSSAPPATVACARLS